jgi:parallel beta-helix repeat protein
MRALALGCGEMGKVAITDLVKYGIYFGGSDTNNVSVNNIVDNEYGVFIGQSLNNTICHNNFINNTQQAHTFSEGYTNVWDDGYPSAETIGATTQE